MELALFLIIIAAVFFLLDAAAQGWGVDSRDESSDPRAPTHGLFVH